MARSLLPIARYLQALVLMAVTDLIQRKKTATVVMVCPHATLIARRARAVVNHLNLGLQTLLPSLLTRPATNPPMALKLPQETTAKARMTRVPKRPEIMQHQDNPLLQGQVQTNLPKHSFELIHLQKPSFERIVQLRLISSKPATPPRLPVPHILAMDLKSSRCLLPRR